jgi:hypothetical protein
MEGVMLLVGILLPQVLSKQQRFRDSLEQLATAYLLPLFSSPYGFLRAKAARFSSRPHCADKSPSSVDAAVAYRMEGAMLLVGILLPQVLCKQQRFRDSLEQLATAYLLPLFSSPYGFLRAKAVWVAGQYASELEFNVPNTSKRQRGQGALFDQLFEVVLKCMNDPYVSFLLPGFFATHCVRAPGAVLQSS